MPTVVNTADGQHVVMPDGTQVYTRNHPYPVSNSEWALSLRRPTPGIRLVIPMFLATRNTMPFPTRMFRTVSMAQNIVMSEIASFGERGFF